MEQITIERIWHPSVEKSNCLNAIAEKDATQAVVAGFYADCIICNMIHMGQLSFLEINLAITKRWPKGLERVKNMAWRIVEKRMPKK